jgi:thiamine-phosphate pyrophosphorylase
VTPPDLIVITDEALSDEQTELRAARILDAVPPGSTALQLRDRRRTARVLLAMAGRLRALCARYGAPLVVNDRVDVARSVDADGVHLGGRSVDIDEARRFVGQHVFVSVAAHDVAGVEAAARSGASAALVSPIYPTPGKGPPRGPELLTGARSSGAHILLYALGGIDAGRAVACVGAGAYGVAAIRSAWCERGGDAAARAMVEAVRASRG